LARKAKELARISRKIERFITKYLSTSSAKGVVVGLSGGLDSSVVMKLAVNALGPEKVLGLIMPAHPTPEQDVRDAVELAKSNGIEYKVIDISPIVDMYIQKIPENVRAAGNLAARVRMNILYYYAALNDYIVAGTSDKSERLIGFFTKFGDGAADILPIAELYKTEVRELASYLRIPAAITEKKSSPRLWTGHLAEEEIGFSYDDLDPMLQLLVDKKKSEKIVAEKLGVPLSEVKKAKNMIDRSAHKRKATPMAEL
jgi:NAD+ synthase